ncbi:radical SAM peptide maturase, CXXX-repeat target family [Peptoniphilus sp. HMSC062D09]|uniref:radical SAM peptide maturase, CXXX-repeat target family n=1 Tax=Peptoniphilus sp. HMSC062D09 TaxID=1739305 RepID=UPI0008A3EAE4|nr:radical SAM peptide maturase, CXXX-repeat target family [Peptoniphilus sp. HMSC062D09]OFK81141.1 hypothetical protein HMPREF2801_06045 [Peptoniphilus sp. HMSC062D09]
MAKMYSVGAGVKEWKNGISQNITFVVTEDCNLRCKYCYICHKSPGKSMSFEVAKKFIDYILSDEIYRPEAVVLDFIGGEPLLEIELIDRICDYFIVSAYNKGSSWWWNYRISMTTNGINYDSGKVQAFIKKYYEKLNISITLDGNKEKHDLQRVFPDGRGSYDFVKKNMDLLLTQFTGATKVTFASDDLPFLKDSIIELWNNGITEVAANVVFEDVWKDNDDKIFEQQLISLADYILENKLYNRYSCTLFDDYIGEPYSKEQLSMTSCGAGKMIAVDGYGKIFPCMRYKSYSLNHHEEWVIGDVDNGINFEKLRPFIGATIALQSDEECLNCNVATGCSFCLGLNYDEAKTPTNYERNKYICKMHKARVRANNYYFSKLYNLFGIERKNFKNEQYKLYFLLSNNYINYCSEDAGSNKSIQYMDKEIIRKGLEFAYKNFMSPVFVHDKNSIKIRWEEYYDNFRILHIIPYSLKKQIPKEFKNILFVLDDSCDINDEFLSNCILNIDSSKILDMHKKVIHVLKFVDRVNINIVNFKKNFEIETYKNELKIISEFIAKEFRKTNKLKEVNVITDDIFINEFCNCSAGDKSITLSPKGNFYVCQGFYSKEPNNIIGDVENGLNNFCNKQLFTMNYAALCRECNVFHCSFCVYNNYKETGEVNISSSFQCIKSHVEKEIGDQLKQELEIAREQKKNIDNKYYRDNIERIMELNNLAKRGILKNIVEV